MGETGSEQRTKGAPVKRRRARPRARRQILWVLAALAALGVGYGVGRLTPGKPAAPPATSQLTAPERREVLPQPAPPVVLAAPALPLRGEAVPAEAAAAEPTVPPFYEEPLPAEIHVPSQQPATVAGLVPRAPPVSGELPAWRRYALHAPVTPGVPRIAIVIDDLGLDRRRTARTTALNGPLTLAFLPYAGELERQTAAARAAGHELLVHVPMEPESRTIDPGPNVLTVGLEEEALRSRIDWDLSRFPGFVGINNHMGSRFTAEPAGMAVVMDELRRRGLLFLDSRTAGGSVGSRLAGEAAVPHVERNVFLDNVDEVSAVRARLAETEELARRRGLAVAIGHPRDATIEALTAWLTDIRQRGFQLIPISAAVRVPDGWESAHGRVPATR